MRTTAHSQSAGEFQAWLPPTTAHAAARLSAASKRDSDATQPISDRISRAAAAEPSVRLRAPGVASTREACTTQPISDRILCGVGSTSYYREDPRTRVFARGPAGACGWDGQRTRVFVRGRGSGTVLREDEYYPLSTCSRLGK